MNLKNNFLIHTENVLGKRIRGSQNAPREWTGVTLRYKVNTTNQTLGIPHTSYDDPGCPSELKQLREFFPDVMSFRPCDSCISIWKLTNIRLVVDLEPTLLLVLFLRGRPLWLLFCQSPIEKMIAMR